MTKPPTVSVVMITYNHENFIKEAIQGVLTQVSDFTIELIIANDKSTDATHQVIDELLEKNIPEHIHIRYYNHKGNKGMMSNFIWALQQAKGKYIALCEGDDYWTDPLKLQKQADFLEENKGFVLCCHNAFFLNSVSSKTQERVIPKLRQDKEYTELELNKGAWILTPTLFFRNLNDIHDILNKVESKILNSDMLLFSILGKFGKGKYIESIEPVMYRVHEGGVWSSKKHDKIFVWWNRYQLEKVLSHLHRENDEVSVFFKKRLTDLNRKLHRNLYRLNREQVKELNMDYFKWNKFEPYRIKGFIKHNFTYLRLKFGL
ncbi:glycosyltransferase family 2 protein [Psychroflexus salinarum]|uniref:Glycosyltransferase family 2 protein n=1 Tax=Psychroflexus salinarum TaxID=546024 RepID=A0ABW3GTD7_9FLAO